MFVCSFILFFSFSCAAIDLWFEFLSSASKSLQNYVRKFKNFKVKGAKIRKFDRTVKFVKPSIVQIYGKYLWDW